LALLLQQNQNDGGFIHSQSNGHDVRVQLGFPDDGYDYLQHLKEMDNEGTPGVHFIPADEPPKQLPADERDYDVRGAHEPEAACSVPPVPPTVSNDVRSFFAFMLLKLGDRLIDMSDGSV